MLDNTSGVCHGKKRASIVMDYIGVIILIPIFLDT